ncbi:EamA family transporter [Colwellia sp. MEBiC06753]
MPASRLTAVAALHGAVMLFALAGLFAKWLPLSAFELVLGRTGFASLTLVIFLSLYQRSALKISLKSFELLIVTAAILLVHWLSFFAAIQYSSVAFGLFIFASFPIFSLLIESCATRRWPRAKELLQVIVIGLGIALIASSLDLTTNLLALFIGLSSAFTFALLLHLNQTLVKSNAATTIACYQNSFAFFIALPFAVFWVDQQALVGTLPELAILGVLLTAFAHSLLNNALTKLTAFVVSLAVCLEPIYGAIAALLMLAEQPNLSLIVGGACILAVNIYQAFDSRR